MHNLPQMIHDHAFRCALAKRNFFYTDAAGTTITGIDIERAYPYYIKDVSTITVPGRIGDTDIVTVGGGEPGVSIFFRRVASPLQGVNKVIIESPITTLATDALFNQPSLTSVVLPDTLTTIGLTAFQSCTNLTSINIPPGLESVGIHAFSDCKNLGAGEDLVLPASLGNNVGQDAFKSTLYKSITIPSTMTYVPYGAFQFMPEVSSISFNNVLTSIGQYAFTGNSYPPYGKVTELVFPNSLTFIGAAAFRYHLIRKVTIPANVTLELMSYYNNNYFGDTGNAFRNAYYAAEQAAGVYTCDGSTWTKQ